MILSRGFTSAVDYESSFTGSTQVHQFVCRVALLDVLQNRWILRDRDPDDLILDIDDVVAGRRCCCCR